MRLSDYIVCVCYYYTVECNLIVVGVIVSCRWYTRILKCFSSTVSDAF